jgi:hypothetical protein
MIAELAAANAAFQVIKTALNNGKELSAIGGKVFDYFDNKAKIQEKATKKTNKNGDRSDMEEFMALEQLNAQETELRERMIYAGRPGLWEDWIKFQAQAASRRRRNKEIAARNALIRKQKISDLIDVIVLSVAFIILAILILYGIYIYVVYF